MFSGRALRGTPRFAMLSARHLCQPHAFCEICCCPWAAPGCARRLAACADASAVSLAGAAQASHGLCMTARAPRARARAQIHRETRCLLPRAFLKRRVSRGFVQADVAKHRVSRCFLVALCAERRVSRCFLRATFANHTRFARFAAAPGPLLAVLGALRLARTLLLHRWLAQKRCRRQPMGALPKQGPHTCCQSVWIYLTIFNLSRIYL